MSWLEKIVGEKSTATKLKEAEKVEADAVLSKTAAEKWHETAVGRVVAIRAEITAAEKAGIEAAITAGDQELPDFGLDALLIREAKAKTEVRVRLAAVKHAETVLKSAKGVTKKARDADRKHRAGKIALEMEPIYARLFQLVTDYSNLKGPSDPDLTIPGMNAEAKAARETAVQRWISPAPAPVADPLRLVRLLRDVGGVSGRPGDGRAYSAREGADFEPEIAARLVAIGAAEYQVETPAGVAVVAKARQMLAENKKYNPERDGTQVDSGWVSNV